MLGSVPHLLPVVEGVAQSLRRRIPGDTHGMPRPVLDIGEGHGRGGEGAVGVEETGVVGGDVGAGHAAADKVRGGAVVGVELDREPVLDTADRQAAAGGSDGVDATGIVMEHEGRPVGPAVAGAEIDIEGDGKVLAHIDAPRRHRRAGLVACRRQGEDLALSRSHSRAASA